VSIWQNYLRDFNYEIHPSSRTIKEFYNYLGRRKSQFAYKWNCLLTSWISFYSCLTSILGWSCVWFYLPPWVVGHNVKPASLDGFCLVESLCLFYGLPADAASAVKASMALVPNPHTALLVACHTWQWKRAVMFGEDLHLLPLLPVTHCYFSERRSVLSISLPLVHSEPYW
jgi:hypothetical protein